MTNRLLRILPIVAVTAGVLVAAPTALANNFCGSTIAASGSFVLPHDHTCPAGTAITIDADNVNLDLGGFTVDGTGTADIGIDVTAGSDDVTVRNGTVTGFDTGVRAGACTALVPPFTDTDDFLLQRVAVRDSAGTGVALCGAGGDMTVRFSLVREAVTGIDTSAALFNSEGIVTVEQSVIRDTTIGVTLQPINFGESYLLNSTVRDAFGTGVAMSMGGSAGATAVTEVSDSTIRGCSNCLRGITVSGEGLGTVVRNTIRDWDEVGVSASSVASLSVEDNVLRSIGGGLFFEGAILLRNQSATDAAGIIHNLIRGTTDGPGIHLICVIGTAADDNVLLDVDGDGILIDDAAPAGSPCPAGVVSQADVLRRNVILGAAGNGVAIITGNAYTLEDNAAGQNALDGFYLGSAVVGCCGTEGAYLTNNQARDNGGDGFQFDTTSLEVTGNLAEDNTGFGFRTVGPVDVDGGNTANNNTAGNCSDPSHLPNSACPP